MKVIINLAFKNLKRYARESFLVILSILLTVSMMTMIASTMNSLYASLMHHRIKTGAESANVVVHNIQDVKGFVDEIRDDISSYLIEGYDKFYANDDADLYANANSYPTCNADDVANWCLRNEITEGRRSENKNEIVVHKDAKEKLGDIITMDVYQNGEIVDEIDVKVVGRSKSLYLNDFYVSEEEMSQGDTNYVIELIFKDDSKNIDKTIDELVKSKKYSNTQVYVVLNNDYNFFMGMQSKPGPLLYATAITTMIMLLLVGLATISLILNAFESLITQQEKSIGTLRSIGMTKEQLKSMVLSQGFILSGIGIVAGMILGVGLGQVLITYVFNNLNEMFITLGAESTLEIFFETSTWIYIVTVISGFSIIYLAQRKKLKELFSKTSIETLREHKLANKKVKVNLSKEPMKGLAKVNTKMTKDFKGIQTALMISVVLLIGINGWVNSFSSVFDDMSPHYDTKVDIYSNNGEDFKNDIPKIIDVLNKYEDEIELIVPVTSLRLVDLSDKNKQGSIYETDLYKEEGFTFDYMEIRVIQDEEFTKLMKQMKLDQNSRSVYNNLIVRVFDDVTTSGDLIDFSDTNTIEIMKFDDDKTINLDIDTIISQDTSEYYELINYNTLLVNESYYQEHLANDFKKLHGQVLVRSELTKDSLMGLANYFNEYKSDNQIYFYSSYFDSYVGLVLNKTVSTITSLIFVYIALVILINVLNISLSTYQIRKQDIAILMSVGASKKQIEEMFLRESLLISFKPYLKGLVIGNAIAFLIVKLTAYNIGQQFKYQLGLFTFILSLVLVTVIILVQYISLVRENKKLDLISDIRSY